MARGEHTEHHPNRKVSRHLFMRNPDSPAEYIHQSNWGAPDPATAVFKRSTGPLDYSKVVGVGEGHIISQNNIEDDVPFGINIYDKDKNTTTSFYGPKVMGNKTSLNMSAKEIGEQVIKSGMLDYPHG
jgi:hypothetical protein